MAVPPIPRGIEVLVKKAAVDAEFRELLLEKRAAAADEIGLELEASETAMLESIPSDLLNRTIDQTTVKPESRAAFLGKAAAAMLAAVGFAGVLGGCQSEPVSRGVRPDSVPAPTGSRPKPVPERPTKQPAKGGIRPEKGSGGGDSTKSGRKHDIRGLPSFGHTIDRPRKRNIEP